MTSLGGNCYAGTINCKDIEVSGRINYPAPFNAIDIEGDGTGVNIDIGVDAGNPLSTNGINLGQSCGNKASVGSINIGLANGFTGAAQGDVCIAIGNRAGRDNQSNSDGVGACVAIGHYAGTDNQHGGAVAIGAHAGGDTQGDYAVAIGGSAGETNQGDNSVCIGRSAGNATCHDNCIMLNATGLATASTAAGGFLVKPIRTLVNPAGAGNTGDLWWDGDEIYANP